MVDIKVLLNQFTNLPMKKITKDAVSEVQAKESKRICFGLYPAHMPKRSGGNGYVGAINLPFGDGISKVFPFQLFPNKKDKFHDGAVWLSIKDEKQYSEIEEWCKKYKDYVFLRDTLYTSIALGFNKPNNNTPDYTVIGGFEDRAKNNQASEAIEELVTRVTQTIQELSCYKDADYICAVPCSQHKPFDLPTTLAERAGNLLGKTNITGNFVFGSEKK